MTEPRFERATLTVTSGVDSGRQRGVAAPIGPRCTWRAERPELMKGGDRGTGNAVGTDAEAIPRPAS